MDPTTVMLIKILTDVAMTAMTTLREIETMTDEQKATALIEAQAVKVKLTDMIRRH